jgi:hypothetical protein
MWPLFKRVVLQLICGAYRAVLYAYPREFRARYGLEMKQMFRNQLREEFSKESSVGFLQFCGRIAWDIASSICRERYDPQTATGMFCVAAAMGIGIYASYIDRHNAHEVYPTLLVAAVGSFGLGLIRPLGAWRWALIIGLAVPFAGPLLTLSARLAIPGNWAILAVVSAPGLVGAYAGSFLRRATRLAH